VEKPQAIKFWKALNDSDNVGDIISKFENKKGYAGKRTLWRWAQLNDGLWQGLSLSEIAKNTGWTQEDVEQKLVWWQSEFGSNKPGKPQPSAAGEGPNTAPTGVPGQGCSCPPDEIDWGQLREKGVPKKIALELLRDWRSCHLAGKHTECRQYSQRLKDISNGVPPEQVLSLLKVRDHEQEFDSQSDPLASDLGRVYHSWEGNANRNAALAEYKERTKPDIATAEAQKNHLNDITKLLKDFAGQVETALDKGAYNVKFDLEESPFFQRGIQSHFSEVEDDLWKFIHLRKEYQQREKHLVYRISKNAPIEANDCFVQSVLGDLLQAGLRKYRPQYRREISSDGFERLDMLVNDHWETIAEGSADIIDRCQQVHAELVREYRGSSETKDLVAQRKSMVAALKDVRKTVKQTLANHKYLRTICPLCPIFRSYKA